MYFAKIEDYSKVLDNIVSPAYSTDDKDIDMMLESSQESQYLQSDPRLSKMSTMVAPIIIADPRAASKMLKPLEKVWSKNQNALVIAPAAVNLQPLRTNIADLKLPLFYTEFKNQLEEKKKILNELNESMVKDDLDGDSSKLMPQTVSFLNVALNIF